MAENKHVITIDGVVLSATRNGGNTCDGCAFLYKSSTTGMANRCMFNDMTAEEYHTEYWRWSCHDNGHIWVEVRDGG